MDNLNYIENIFNEKIKGKTLISKKLTKHDGQQGHNIEKELNIQHNCKNEPDLFGYEIKTGANKTTLGDYKASEYIFNKNKPFINIFNKWTNEIINKNDFLKIFGTIKKNNRYTWSGECVPKYNLYNDIGQTLEINKNNDICIYYRFDKDKRDKNITNDFPDFLKKDRQKILIVIWKKEKMENHINNKFNINGTIKFIKNKDKKFIEMNVYKPFNYNYFIKEFKENNIIFDSGMSNSSARLRSNFRSNHKFWDKLLIK